MIKEVLLAITMSYGTGGTTGYKSESATIVKDLDTCRAAALAYVRSRDQVKDVSYTPDRITFKSGVLMPDIYVVQCVPIEPPTGHEF